MLNKIKSLLKKQPETKAISRSELPSFIEQQMQENDIGAYTHQLRETLNTNADLLEERADVLEKATLKNDNIPSRAKTIMQGNREQYIVKTKEFASLLRDFAQTFKKLETPYGVKNELENLKERIEAFSKNTHKQYQILQEFFSHESFRIAEVIRETDKLRERTLKDLYGSELFMLHKVKGLLEEIEGLSKKKEDLAGQVTSRRSDVEEEKKKEKAYKTEKKELLESDEYAGFESLKQNIQKKEKRISALRDEISKPFMTMSRALRKYSKVSMQPAIVNGLLSDAPRTLTQYKAADINDTLTRLQESLSNLELKPNVVKKTQEGLAGISKEWLHAKGQELSTIFAELETLRKQEQESEIPDKIETIDGKIDRSQKRQAEMKEEIKELEKQKNASSEEKLYEQIKELLNEHHITLDPYTGEHSA